MKADIMKGGFAKIVSAVAITIAAASIIAAIVFYNYAREWEIKLREAEAQQAANQTEQTARPAGQDVMQASAAAIKPDYGQDLIYQTLYPDLYTEGVPQQTREDKVIYLTFDDGPTQVTNQILDILKAKKVQATFFVIGRNLETEKNKEILRRIVREGHTVGVHTYSHKYSSVYESVESYLEDFNRTYLLIDEITGIKPAIFRFPGGSVNGYDEDNYQEIIAEMSRRGFVYYDWNVSAQDSQGQKTSQAIYNNIVPNAKEKNRSIVLMHDGSDNSQTALALNSIIDSLLKAGFELKPLSPAVKPIIFAYPD